MAPKNFLQIAKDIGPDAAIVKGHDDAFSGELKDFLERWMNCEFAILRIERVDNQHAAFGRPEQWSHRSPQGR
jgi:hypothetical protein